MKVGILFEFARHQSRVACRRSEFAITLTDDSAMAAAAMIGDSSNPIVG